jgi:hypothetical protein
VLSYSLPTSLNVENNMLCFVMYSEKGSVTKSATKNPSHPDLPHCLKGCAESPLFIVLEENKTTDHMSNISNLNVKMFQNLKCFES